MAARLQRPAPIGRIPAARAPVGCSAGPSPGLALPRRIAPGQRAAEGRREPLPAPRPADSDRHRDGTGSRTRDRERGPDRDLEREQGPGQGAGNGSREQGAGTRDRDQDQGPGTRTRGSRRAPAAGRGSTAAPMWPGGPSGPPCAPRVLPAAAGTGSARAGRGQPLPSPSRARLLGGRPRDPLGWPGAGGESRAFVHPSDSPRKGGAQTAASPPECHLPPRRWGMSGERNPPSHRSRSLHLPLTLGKAEMRRGLC